MIFERTKKPHQKVLIFDEVMALQSSAALRAGGDVTRFRKQECDVIGAKVFEPGYITYF